MLAVKIIAVFALAIGIYFLCRGIFHLISKKGGLLGHSELQQYLSRRNLGKRCLLAIPGIALYFLLFFVLERESPILIWLHKIDIIYLTIVFLMIANSVMLTFLEVNGKPVRCTSQEVAETGWAVAAGRMDYDALLQWVRAHT